MVLKKITAIIPARKLKEVEHGLQRIGVAGITITLCKGYGEYERFANFDWSLSRAVPESRSIVPPAEPRRLRRPS